MVERFNVEKDISKSETKRISSLLYNLSLLFFDLNNTEYLTDIFLLQSSWRIFYQVIKEMDKIKVSWTISVAFTYDNKYFYYITTFEQNYISLWVNNKSILDVKLAVMLILSILTR